MHASIQTMKIYVKDFVAEEWVKSNMQEKGLIGISLIRNRKRDDCIVNKCRDNKWLEMEENICIDSRT